jgi:hypothetical protein
MISAAVGHIFLPGKLIQWRPLIMAVPNWFSQAANRRQGSPGLDNYNRIEQ